MKPGAVRKVVPIGDQRKGWEGQITTSKNGTPHPTHANAIVIIANTWPAKTLAYDVFANEIQTTQRPPWDAGDVPPEWKPGPWTPQDDVRTAAVLARRFGLRVGLDVTRAAVDIVARQNETHPVRAYLTGLRWDGVHRVRELFSRYFRADRSAYSEAVSHLFMVGAVARVMEPGCKVDTMVVGEGDQGLRKSTGIRVLTGDEWFSDTPLDLSSKDRFVALRGKWIIEIAELDAFDRHESTRIKAFISSATDVYRPPYGRSDERFPRQCMFIGTTNASGYLRDVTGNRRFLPLRFGRVDVDALAADRDQLWAEARTLYEEGARWWPDEHMTATFAAEQAARVAVDSWEETIAEWIDGKDFVTVSDILSRCFGLEEAKHGQAEQTRVARALVKLGRRRTQKQVGGVRKWGYCTSQTEVVQ